MDRDSELRAGETLALRAFVISIFAKLRCDPSFQPFIMDAFDEAAGVLQDEALQAGTTVSAEPLVNALNVIERLRSAIHSAPERAN
jgi:hypothetical protein